MKYIISRQLRNKETGEVLLKVQFAVESLNISDSIWLEKKRGYETRSLVNTIDDEGNEYQEILYNDELEWLEMQIEEVDTMEELSLWSRLKNFFRF